MARHYSMPYMGSKQKLVDKIIPLILSRHNGATDFYDLFGGGGSVSFYDWAISQPVPVYFSSYKISDKRFKLIKAINTRSNLDYRTRANAAYNFENVYWNGVE